MLRKTQVAKRKETAIQLYKEEQIPISIIAERLNVSTWTVREWVKGRRGK